GRPTADCAAREDEDAAFQPMPTARLPMTAALAALRLDAGRLDAFQVFAGHTPSAICSGVASVLCPHEMELAAPGRRCDASLSRMPVGGLSLVKLRYGSEVAVRPEPSSGFVMLQLVL